MKNRTSFCRILFLGGFFFSITAACSQGHSRDSCQPVNPCWKTKIPSSLNGACPAPYHFLRPAISYQWPSPAPQPRFRKTNHAHWNKAVIVIAIPIHEDERKIRKGGVIVASDTQTDKFLSPFGLENCLSPFELAFSAY